MTNSKPQDRNRFRIIAGQWRGRVLKFADVEDIRPTADRVRETLFNWLQSEIVGANCLDLFAGSGALGFEALSRGAASLTSLELSHQACQTLQENIQTLQTENSHLINANALDWLSSNPATQAFDIVFLDPPFNKDYLQTCCAQLENGSWLADNAFIYLESKASLKNIELPKRWQLIKEKKAGQVFYAACRRNKP